MSYDEKATVSIDSDGNVLKCAKGAAAAECGFVKGAALCAKCGAMPVEMKMVPAAEAEEKPMDDTEEMPKAKKKPSMDVGIEMAPEEDEPELTDDEMAAFMPKKKAAKKEIMMTEDESEEMADEEDDDGDMEIDMSDEKMYGSRTRGKKAMAEAEISEEEEDEDENQDQEEDSDEEMSDEEMPGEDEDEEEDDEEEMMGERSFSPRDPEWEEIRRSRIKSLGIKTADIGASGYLCALERKAYAGSAPVCDDCPGGCVAEKGMPGILHVEGLAEKMFSGVVVDSGYSPQADMFVVDVQAKDGSIKEVFVDGTSAEILGFHKLDSSEFEQKADIGSYKLIDFTEAAEIAVKSIDGHVVAVEPDVFEGFDAYAVEIEGLDGKSYDVFVALDGEVLGYDKYEADEVEAIEAEAAEIAIKRAFSEERRMELAKEGMALPDGSYPIVNETDLRNAIQAFGRAKDKEAAKRHIMKRARAMNMESLIPANWLAGSKEKGEQVSDADFIASLVEFQLLEDSLDDK